MTDYIRVDSKKFAVYHAVYVDSNIFLSFDWNDRLSYLSPENDGYFIVRDNIPIGGFTLTGNRLSFPFMISPFENRQEYWELALKFAVQTSGQNEIFLCEIPDINIFELTQSFGAKVHQTQRRMLRPTDSFNVELDKAFYFDNMERKNIPEIVQAVYDAHSSGYTSTVRKPDIDKIESAVTRRFDSFQKTSSLYMGNLVREKNNNELAGVCIAGIYPDSPDNFATIHQVSVRPKYRRKGIAREMIRKSINDARVISPVITLGVLVGNPAEILYKSLGFIPGPSYSDLVCSI